jgi:hypothetical protein
MEVTAMSRAVLTRLLAGFIALCMTNLAVVQSAGAATIGTQTLIQLEDRAVVVARVQARLAHEDLRQALVALGVDPAQARERVAALTDAEIALLDEKLATLPAGGDGGWVLLVIVLAALVILFAMGKLQYK